MNLPLESIAVTVVTVSDRCARGEAEDASGPAITAILGSAGALTSSTIVEDGVATVTHALRSAHAAGARVIITTGGTGIAPRDFTPEATSSVLTRLTPGVVEALRAGDSAIAGAQLSRAVAGVMDASGAERLPAFVVNLPGSLHAATQGAQRLIPVLAHAVAQMDGSDHHRGTPT